MTTPDEVAQGLTPDAQVVLFEMDLTPLGGTVLRFTPSSKVGGTVSFNSNIYTEVEVLATGFEWTVDGPAPRPKLRISNANQIVGALMIEFGDLRGAQVARIRTFRRFLDDGAEPDGTAMLSYELYFIDKKNLQGKSAVEVELAGALDQQGRMIPGRQVLKQYCTHRYRVWDPVGQVFDYTNATCPYTGTDLFDAQGNVVAVGNEEQDHCGKKLFDCRLRFGQHGILPTRAFPGIVRIRGV